MNKTMVYSISALLCLSALAGCGRLAGEDTRPTERPVTTSSPMIVTPDPEDGYVRDEDGIITDDDTGRDDGDHGTGRPTTEPGASAMPGGTAAPRGSGSPSPSPSAGTKMR
ncbi:MAG: hypothetical protein IKO22_03125 [Oscillospiraceae bacterium]|nr:hypothetical protein [Oscillospiraceae bacterium]